MEVQDEARNRGPRYRCWVMDAVQAVFLGISPSLRRRKETLWARKGRNGPTRGLRCVVLEAKQGEYHHRDPD